MTEGVHEYKYIASQMKGPNKPKRPCTNCQGIGWVDVNYMFGVGKIVCSVCGNPKGHQQP